MTEKSGMSVEESVVGWRHLDYLEIICLFSPKFHLVPVERLPEGTIRSNLDGEYPQRVLAIIQPPFSTIRPLGRIYRFFWRRARPVFSSWVPLPPSAMREFLSAEGWSLSIVSMLISLCCFRFFFGSPTFCISTLCWVLHHNHLNERPSSNNLPCLSHPEVWHLCMSPTCSVCSCFHPNWSWSPRQLPELPSGALETSEVGTKSSIGIENDSKNCWYKGTPGLQNLSRV